MVARLIALVGGRLSKPVVITLSALLLAALAAWGGWWTVSTVTGWLEERDLRVERLATEAERKHWVAQIAIQEAKVSDLRLEMAKTALQSETRLRDLQVTHERDLEHIRTQNAALPNAGACGISRERVRLLNRSRAAARR